LSRLGELDFERLGISPADRKKLLDACAADHSLTPSRSARRIDKAPTAPTKAERRHLTVLFCDFVGSTHLSTRLDPEDLREILLEFQRCCSEVITRYGGHIARYMGDGILAYFGFPQAHEDDAERAVSAALDILSAVSALSFPRTPPIEIRAGIATGLVVVGDLIGEGPSREFALVGEAPNLAAWLQQHAEPNQILVASSTRRLLGELFQLADLGEHQVKGHETPVRVWRVLRQGAAPSRFEARRSSTVTAFTGRDAELGQLHKHYKMAKRGKGQIVLLSGEPGIGKSRLIMTLKNELAGEDCRTLSFQCSSYHTSSAWYPVVRHLEDVAEISRDTSPTSKLNKLKDLLDRHGTEPKEAVVPLLAALLSIPTDDRYPPLELIPHQQKTRTFAALLAFFQAQTRQQPIILVFEDVHWIDPTSLEFLELLRDRVKSWRMLVLLSSRPGQDPSWQAQPHLTSLALKRLTPEHVVSMVESLAGVSGLSRKIVDQIVAKTDGVPLFVEEVTKAVLEADGHDEGNGRSPSQPVVTVPATLHESLMARLDQAGSKTIAQIASAIGREFSLRLLQAIAQVPRRDLRAAIDRLLGSGLLLRIDHAAEQVFAFKHALVQDEAYASMLREERRQLHIRIAESLCSKFVEVADTSPELIAHHYTRAAEIRPAIDYWLKAGRQASGRSAFVEATTHFQIALNLLEDLPADSQRDQLELALQQSLASALIAVKGFGAAETVQAFRRALALCQKLDGSPQVFAVLNGMVGVHMMCAEFEQSRRVAEELLTRARAQSDPTPILMGHRVLGMSLFVIGELAAAQEELRSVLALYDPSRHAPLSLVFSQDFKATAQAYLALASVVQGDISGGLANGRAALEHAERLRHPHSICYVLPFLAGAYLVAGSPEEAYPVTERTIALSSEYGFPQWSAGGLMLRGWAQLDLGKLDDGLADIRSSIDALEATGTLIWVQFARFLFAQALAKAGQTRLATELVDRILLELGGTSGRWYEAELHRLKGDLLLGLGRAKAAEASYEAAIAVAKRQGARLWELRATNALGAMLRDHVRASELHARLGPLYAGFERGLVGPDLLTARTLLGGTAHGAS
jgi:class 3 adenylate cyclase/predicted ATPase/DNA polymerase III delta prime subunit